MGSDDVYSSPDGKIKLPPGTTLVITPSSNSVLKYSTTANADMAGANAATATATTDSVNTSLYPNMSQPTFSLNSGEHQLPPASLPSHGNPQNYSPHTVTFLNSEEIPKFRGRRLQTDEIFTHGPSFDELASNLNAYFIRHNLNNDEEKINALRLLVHPTQGDERFVLAHFLDPALNRERFSYEQLNHF